MFGMDPRLRGDDGLAAIASTQAGSSIAQRTIHPAHGCHQESKLVIAARQDHNDRKPGS
ncbi:MAG TPA: hypothetical protein VF793_19115 [Telluria sp.]|jgi:hypothetical protein